MSESTPLVVCDAGPLIHLDELGCLDLLDDFPLILISPAVEREVEQHRPSALTKLAEHSVRKVAVARPIGPDLVALAKLLPLHAGELEALQVALECEANLFLTDDTAARLAARNLSLTAKGTIGVLVRAIRRKRRSKAEVVQIIQSIPERSTLHVKASLLERVVQEIESSS